MKKLMITVMVAAIYVNILTACSSSKITSEKNSVEKAAVVQQQDTNNLSDKELAEKDPKMAKLFEENQEPVKDTDKPKEVGAHVFAYGIDYPGITGVEAMKLRELCDEEEKWITEISYNDVDDVEEYYDNGGKYPSTAMWVYLDKKYPTCRGGKYHTDFKSDNEVVYSIELIDYDSSETSVTQTGDSTNVDLVAPNGRVVGRKDITVTMDEKGNLSVTEEHASLRSVPQPMQQ